jgi:hypothetical protein
MTVAACLQFSDESQRVILLTINGPPSRASVERAMSQQLNRRAHLLAWTTRLYDWGIAH